MTDTDGRHDADREVRPSQGGQESQDDFSKGRASQLWEVQVDTDSGDEKKVGHRAAHWVGHPVQNVVVVGVVVGSAQHKRRGQQGSRLEYGHGSQSEVW